ncbi:GlxA family transcriptional regulator [Pseudaestuariivita sp.]|uniref:GlxA family transcriptional regulator n=1 Tax=Pseudaestuariivita sp. TaxID=2211669 RepID=UPI004058DFF8
MPDWTCVPQERVNVSFLLLDQFSNLCLANCLEPLRAANMFCGAPVFAWQVFSVDGGPVESSSGLPIVPDGAFEELLPEGVVQVLASYGHGAHDTAALRRRLAALRRPGVRVVGHDTAPWLMAAAGLLDGRMATVHWDVLDAFAERFLAVTALRERVVRDGPVWTSAGAMAAYDLTLKLVEETCGAAMAIDIAGLFLSDGRQTGRHVHEGDEIGAMLAVIRDTLEAPLSVPELARRVGLDPKTLERRCRARLGAPPSVVARHIRLSAAYQWVLTTRQPVSEIALRAGYETPAALTRAFKARFGVTPRDLRQTGSKRHEIAAWTVE